MLTWVAYLGHCGRAMSIISREPFFHKTLVGFLKEGKLVEISGGMFDAADVLTASAAMAVTSAGQPALFLLAELTNDK